MSSHRSFRFSLCTIAVIVTQASARAPSEDTPPDQIVSCVYPLSGQYGLLPRLLFYTALIFSSTMRRSGWFSSIVLGLAMSYSITAFVHIIAIYATHGFYPPILDLDVLGIFLLATVTVSMYPAQIVLQSKYKILATQFVVSWWWHIMFYASTLASMLLNNFRNLPRNSNAEVACYLPDDTLLTSLAQLNGSRDLECIYDCFLTRRSVLRDQDAVTVMWGGEPTNGSIGNWGLLLGGGLSGLMLVFGSHIATYPKHLQRLSGVLLKPADSVANPDSRAIMTPIVYICLLTLAPWVVMVEYSLRSVPVEETSYAIGQWGPWVAAVFAFMGGAIYHALEDPKEERPEPALYGVYVNSPPDTDYMMSGALALPGDNTGLACLADDDRPGDDSHGARVGDDEIDLGTCTITRG